MKEFNDEFVDGFMEVSGHLFTQEEISEVKFWNPEDGDFIGEFITDEASVKFPIPFPPEKHELVQQWLCYCFLQFNISHARLRIGFKGDFWHDYELRLTDVDEVTVEHIRR
jgi:hypothetical protein